MKTGAADHHRLLAAAKEWRGGKMAIATVIETWRSAPCPVGTHMLVHADGRFVGSVSGGCVEGDVLQTSAEIIAGAPFAVRRYGVANGAAWEVGLPCGGDIAVLIQPVSESGFAEAYFAEIEVAQADRASISLFTDLETGVTALTGRDADFQNTYLPPRRLIIVGAVEIAAILAKIARDIGISVALVDPRGQFLTVERFPGVQLDDRWPDEAIRALKPDTRTAIITLSHDVKLDDPALLAALESDAGYIAALGSQASHAARLKRLQAAGVMDVQLARIEGPAGVSINAISAPEIAISIAGGMVRALNNGLR